MCFKHSKLEHHVQYVSIIILVTRVLMSPSCSNVFQTQTVFKRRIICSHIYLKRDCTYPLPRIPNSSVTKIRVQWILGCLPGAAPLRQSRCFGKASNEILVA